MRWTTIGSPIDDANFLRIHLPYIDSEKPSNSLNIDICEWNVLFSFFCERKVSVFCIKSRRQVTDSKFIILENIWSAKNWPYHRSRFRLFYSMHTVHIMMRINLVSKTTIPFGRCEFQLICWIMQMIAFDDNFPWNDANGSFQLRNDKLITLFSILYVLSCYGSIYIYLSVCRRFGPVSFGLRCIFKDLIAGYYQSTSSMVCGALRTPATFFIEKLKSWRWNVECHFHAVNHLNISLWYRWRQRQWISMINFVIAVHLEWKSDDSNHARCGFESFHLFSWLISFQKNK